MYFFVVFFFFFKQKTAYEMLRSLVGSEMCIRDSTITSPKSDLTVTLDPGQTLSVLNSLGSICTNPAASMLSLIHISEPTRLLSISYAVFCLKKKKKQKQQKT